MIFKNWVLRQTKHFKWYDQLWIFFLCICNWYFISIDWKTNCSFKKSLELFIDNVNVIKKIEKSTIFFFKFHSIITWYCLNAQIYEANPYLIWNQTSISKITAIKPISKFRLEAITRSKSLTVWTIKSKTWKKPS